MSDWIEPDSIQQQTAGASGGFSASGWVSEALASLEGVSPEALADLRASLSAPSPSTRRAPARRAGHPLKSPFAVSVAARPDPLNPPPGASAPASSPAPTPTAPIATTASSARKENHMQQQSSSQSSSPLSSDWDYMNDPMFQTIETDSNGAAGAAAPHFGLGELPDVGAIAAEGFSHDDGEAIVAAETNGGDESAASPEAHEWHQDHDADVIDAQPAAHDYVPQPDELNAAAAQIAAEHAATSEALSVDRSESIAPSPAPSTDLSVVTAQFSARELPLLPPVERSATPKLSDGLKTLRAASGGVGSSESSLIRDGQEHLRRIEALVKKAARLTGDKEGCSEAEIFEDLQELASLLPGASIDGTAPPDFWKLVIREKISPTDPMFAWMALTGVSANLSRESVSSTILAGRQAGALVLEAVLNAGQGLLDALGDQQFEGLEAIRSQFNGLLGGLNELRAGIAMASESAAGASKQLVESAAAARETCEQVSREIEAVVDNAGPRLKSSFAAEVQTAAAEMRAEISSAAQRMQTLRDIAADEIRKDAVKQTSDVATRVVKWEKAVTDIEAEMTAMLNATRSRLQREAEAAGKAVRAEGDRAAREQVSAVDKALQASVQKATDRISGSAVAATEMVASRVGDIAAAAINKANKRNTWLLYASCAMSFVAFAFELGSRFH